MKSKEDQAAEEFLAELGLALFNAQALEYSLTSVFAATELRRKTKYAVPIDLKDLMDTRYRYTLGRLVRDAAGSLELDEGLTASLEKALVERNWLIHDFYREFAPSVFDTGLRSKAFERLRQSRETMEQVSTQLHDLARSRVLDTGIPPDDLDRGIKAATEDYIRQST